MTDSHGIAHREKRIVLSVTHSLRHLALYDSVVVLYQGRLAYHGTSDYLFHYFHVTLPEELFPRLAERRKQVAGTMSGGEQQMLAMGRALMGAPKLLMLDEPSLGLAPIIVADIFRTIGELRSAGVSVLLVEQNAQAALQHDVAERKNLVVGHVEQSLMNTH